MYRRENVRTFLRSLVLILFVARVRAATKVTSSTPSGDQFDVAYEWKLLDYEYPNDEARDADLKSGAFVPENNVPVGMEVVRDRVFLTVPRWKKGVPSALNYFRLGDNNTSPKLTPYPNWESNCLPQFCNSNDPASKIISPFRIRADACGRLWVLDTGVSDLQDPTVVFGPRLLVFDLETDQLLRRFTLPRSQVKQNVSFFANLVIDADAESCEKSFAYLADIAGYGIVVYDWARQLSWRVSHDSFHPEPQHGSFSAAGKTFSWQDGVFGLALSRDRGHDTLYYHPFCGVTEYSVPTTVLRNDRLAGSSGDKFRSVGHRAEKGQASVSVMGPDGVMFYTQVQHNSVACWNTTAHPTLTPAHQGTVMQGDAISVFPNDLNVDSDGILWVLTNKLPVFLFGNLDEDVINFRILKAPVEKVVAGSVCSGGGHALGAAVGVVVYVAVVLGRLV